ncbi:hypothetical protein KUCAC02_035030, partial [Chaenocephalus aceratus]
TSSSITPNHSPSSRGHRVELTVITPTLDELQDYKAGSISILNRHQPAASRIRAISRPVLERAIDSKQCGVE